MSTPSGFDRAPVSKGLLCVSVVSSVIGVIVSQARPAAGNYFALTSAGLMNGEIWRLLTSQLCFTSTSESVLGFILLYHIRLFERHFGSNKYAASVLFFMFANLVVQVIVALSSGDALPSFSPGLYSLIFGLLPSFYFDIPSIVNFRLWKLPLSDKTALYVLALQLAFAAFPNSTLTAACALLLGAIWRIRALRLDRCRIPSIIVGATERCVGFWATLWGAVVGGGAGARGGPSSGGHRFAGGGYRLGGNTYERVIDDDGVGMGSMNTSFGTPLVEDATASAPHVEVNREALTTLTSMGFDEARARQALISTSNNVDAATSILLQ